MRLVGALLLLATTTGCSLVFDPDTLKSGDAGSTTDGTVADGAAVDAPSVDSSGDTSTVITDASDSGTDSGSDAGACKCTGIVSAYLFGNPNTLGQDLYGKNNMLTVVGTPKQSALVPPGFGGHSIEVDGASSVCINNGYTFNSSADHTLCWWSRPTALANQTNQFAQQCGYDTWTNNNGANYLWRINNCNSGTPADLVIPNVYQSGKWVQHCQTYTASMLKRSVVLNGQIVQKATVVDGSAIAQGTKWCIGSYGSGGYWTGQIYQPMWFDRVLSDQEIQDVYSKNCCLQ